MMATVFPSPLGELTLAAEDGALTGLWLPAQKGQSQGLTPGDAPVLDAAKDWLWRYFAGEAPDPRALPLAPRGSAFAQDIWRMLLEIPYGRTTTYVALAARVSAKRGLAHMSAQAVGGAVGQPHRDPHPLPPRARCAGTADRLCRGTRRQALPAGTRGNRIQGIMKCLHHRIPCGVQERNPLLKRV